MSRMVRDIRFSAFERTPDIVFLQIGGNDIDSGIPVRTVFRDIISFSNFLVKGCEVKTVLTGQVFRRRRTGSYNEKVVELNKLLKDLTVKNEESNVCFHHHHGFWNSMDFLAPDGVHIRCTDTDTQQMH